MNPYQNRINPLNFPISGYDDEWESISEPQSEYITYRGRLPMAQPVLDLEPSRNNLLRGKSFKSFPMRETFFVDYFDHEEDPLE